MKPTLQETTDLDFLSTYLEKTVADFQGVKKLTKINGGQSNPTFILEAQSGKYVLRSKPMGKLLPSAHAIDREYRVMNALSDTNVPVPPVLHYCTDPAVFGSEFYIMGFIEGRVFYDQSLPDLASADRRKIYDQMNMTLAKLHNIDIDAVGLSDYGKPANYFSRQTSRWIKQYEASQTEDNHVIINIIKWLKTNLPVTDHPVGLVHGDFRMDNFMFAPQSSQAIALMDWELSTLGATIADLAYQVMMWRLPPGKFTRGLHGVHRDYFQIPTDEEYIESYMIRRGITTLPDWTFALAFSFFRLIAILQGVKKRALQGNAASPDAMKMASLIDPLARHCTNVIEIEDDTKYG